MNWIVTFILGWIAGAVGMHMFVMWYGKRIAARDVTHTTIDGVFHGSGNPIPEDDPRYQEAVEQAREIAKIFEEQTKKSGGD